MSVAAWLVGAGLVGAGFGGVGVETLCAVLAATMFVAECAISEATQAAPARAEAHETAREDRDE